MNSAADTSVLDAMLAPLLHLTPAERLEAIARLAQSLQSASPTQPATAETAAASSLPAFVGAWANDPEADKMEDAIKSSRHFAAKPELEQWP